jgi:hypothetical protein
MLGLGETVEKCWRSCVTCAGGRGVSRWVSTDPSVIARRGPLRRLVNSHGARGSRWPWVTATSNPDRSFDRAIMPGSRSRRPASRHERKAERKAQRAAEESEWPRPRPKRYRERRSDTTMSSARHSRRCCCSAVSERVAEAYALGDRRVLSPVYRAEAVGPRDRGAS